jgi:hypothetical protein
MTLVDAGLIDPDVLEAAIAAADEADAAVKDLAASQAANRGQESSGY